MTSGDFTYHVGVVGAGYVGVPLAQTFADAGRNVLLVDVVPGIVEALGELFDAGHRVYLHCNAGFNRAPTAAIAWLHVGEGLDLDEAERVVKAHRSCLPYRRALEIAFPPVR